MKTWHKKLAQIETPSFRFERLNEITVCFLQLVLRNLQFPSMRENQDSKIILQFLCDCDSFVYNQVRCKRSGRPNNHRQPENKTKKVNHFDREPTTNRTY